MEVKNTTQETLPEAQMSISVRGLVEFILREGDIDNRHRVGGSDAMQEGGRIHRMIQRRMGAEYEAEVSLRYTHVTPNYVLVVEGRADGIINTTNQQTGKEEVVIDEIKGTYREIHRMKEPAPLHLAQAKCYAYIYGIQKNIENIQVRMTYCNIETEEIRYFYEECNMQELEKWFQSLITAYLVWTDYQWEWKQIRQKSIDNLNFPFPYREGQKELVANVYQTIYHKRKLFLEAPTGVGKTISTVFPSIKAMGKGMADRIFYFTAKTITRTVADNTFVLLREHGLKFKSVILTAKEKICFTGETNCNPEHCPYAKGHYDRINDAVYDLLTKEESFTRENVEKYARKHTVCPFEMCLDMSLFSDGIIADYNYLFDPHVYLKRFFAEGASGNHIFLVDEAHNLLDRGREMYSATLVKEEFMELRNILVKLDQGEAQKDSGVLVRLGYASRIGKRLEKCNNEMLKLKRECETYCIVSEIDPLVQAVQRLYSTIDNYLEEQEEQINPIRDLILDFYFNICHFLDIYERVDKNYVKYTQLNEQNRFSLKLFCVNPSVNLEECMKKGRSSILFSATLLPIQYYKSLLGGNAEDYEVYAQSIFNPEKRALLIANDVTSKYSRRSDDEYYNIARHIDNIVKNRHGNYMVFCPSYSFLHTIYDKYLEFFADDEKECIIQQERMNEQDREDFLAKFEGNEQYDIQLPISMDIEFDEDHTLIGFCVLGGIFSEGIDLKNDSLIGAIIVGTGIPQVCYEREIIKNYFDSNEESGFDYSYRYPGMNKVMQAAGRVIRTVDDIGVIALLDERFLQYSYQRMFPREWETFEVVDVETISRRVERFWDSWL